MKNRIITSTIFLVSICFVVSIVKFGMYFKELKSDYQDSLEQAIRAGQEYLEEKYEQKMVYVEHTSIYDKMVWSITFSDMDNPEQFYIVGINESYDRTSTPVKKHFRVVSVDYK